MSLSTTGRQTGSVGDVLLPLAVAGTGLLCLWRLSQACTVPVHPRCITVIYETRRKTILCTSADGKQRASQLPRVTHFSPFLYLGSLLLFHSGSRLLIPPSSFFGVFTMPITALEDPGESVHCTVEAVEVCDGAVTIALTVQYIISLDELERYLAAVGPEPPNEVIAKAAAQVARLRCTDLSAGILLSKSRRDGIFMDPYKDHLASKLMSEAAVEVKGVFIDAVSLVDGV